MAEVIDGRLSSTNPDKNYDRVTLDVELGPGTIAMCLSFQM